MVEGNRKIDTHSLINLGIAAMAFTGYVLMGITNNMDPEYVPNLASPTLALAVVVVLLGGAMAYSYSARCAVGAVESTTPPPPAKSNRPKAKSVQYTKPERDLVKDAARKQAARARRKANQKLNPSRSSDRLSDPVPAEDGHKPESAPPVDPMPAWDHDDDMDTGPKQWEKATYDLYGHKGDGPWKTVKIEHHRQVAADDGNETEERKDVKETFTVDQVLIVIPCCCA